MRPRRTVLATLLMAGALSVFAAGTALALVSNDGGGDSGGGTNTCSALHLAFATQPGGGAPGSAWAQQPVVDVMTSCNTFQFYDLGGPVITLAITSGTGTSGAVLTCTSNPLTIGDFADGVTFSGCKIDLAGQYTLTATVTNTLPAADAATSNPFNIGTPPANSTLQLAVSGSQTFGGSPSFQVDNPPGGVTLTGTPTCTAVGTNTAISTTLASASYTILGTSCSGVSATGYTISYIGTDLGFDVNPAPLTVHVSGSQTFAGSPAFTSDAPSGATGTLSCGKVGSSTTIKASLGVADYTILGSSCSGLSLANHTISYAGATDGFVVSPAPLTVNVSGSQTFAGSPSFTSDAPSGTTGTLSCSTVGSSTTIDAALGVGNYTILGSSCSGLSLANHTISYAGVLDGFVVSPAPITVNVSGSQTFGGSASFTSDAPSGATGTLSCGTVGSSTTINASLGVANYTILGSSCSGLSLANHMISYAGVTDGFVVSKATITVNVSGSQTFGGSPTFTDGTPVGVSGSPSCSTVDSGTSINASLAVGTHTIDGLSCSGVTANDATDYQVAYQGAPDGFVVSKAVTSLLYNSPNIVYIGNSFSPSATLSSAASACVGSKTISFSLDSDPVTGVAGSYALGSATTASGGTATMSPAIATSGWRDGVYTVTASFAGTTSCEASSDSTTLSIASPGDTASGGGWYTLSGAGRVNFGFTVRQLTKQPPTYSGQFVLINTGKWRVKGTLTAYAKTSTGTGTAGGTGALYWWNQTLNAGLGDWQLAKSPVSVTFTFTPSTSGKKTSPGTFGVQISYKPVSPQPSTLPNSTPQPLKGGSIKLS